MGPNGMKELGETILQRSNYAVKKLSESKLLGEAGVKASRFSAPGFKEFVVDFSMTKLSVEDVNRKLLEKGIFGGRDLSGNFPELGHCSLYAVTEMVSQEEIENLVKALEEILGGAR